MNIVNKKQGGEGVVVEESWSVLQSPVRKRERWAEGAHERSTASCGALCVIGGLESSHGHSAPPARFHPALGRSWLVTVLVTLRIISPWWATVAYPI